MFFFVLPSDENNGPNDFRHYGPVILPTSINAIFLPNSIFLLRLHYRQNYIGLRFTVNPANCFYKERNIVDVPASASIN